MSPASGEAERGRFVRGPSEGVSGEADGRGVVRSVNLRPCRGARARRSGRFADSEATGTRSDSPRCDVLGAGVSSTVVGNPCSVPSQMIGG